MLAKVKRSYLRKIIQVLERKGANRHDLENTREGGNCRGGKGSLLLRLVGREHTAFSNP